MSRPLPLITIVIPIYNVNEYIEECLLSVINQTYTGNIECILVNDCSLDTSIETAKTIINKYNGPINFKIINHTSNRGLSAARNTGIQHAEGEYIYFLDSDDKITPSCIEELVNPTLYKKYDFVIGDYQISGNATSNIPELLLESGEITNNEEIITTYFNNYWYMMAWNKLCNLKYLKSNNLYFQEGLIHEDDLWSFQVACTANSMYSVNIITYIYKLRKDSIITSNKFIQHINAINSIISYMVEFAIQHPHINPIAYNIIYNYKLSILKKSTCDLNILKKTYRSIRYIKNTDNLSFVKSKKEQLYQKIINIHYYLPINIGYRYIYICLKLMTYQPWKRIKRLFKHEKS